MSTSKQFRTSTFFVVALVMGMLLAAGVSVWATSVGTDVSVTGSLTVSSATASSSVTYALGVGTSTPAVQLSVGGAKGNATGHGYFTGGLGVGAISTTAGRIIANVDLGIASTTPIQELSVVGDAYITSTIGLGTSSAAVELSVVGDGYFTGGIGAGVATGTAGMIQNTQNALFGDAAADLVMFNAASLIFNNAGTSTIPSSNADAWNFATSSANIPLLKFDTSNTRVGIGTTSPSQTFAVDGTAVFTGDVSVGGTFTPTQTAATVFLVGGGYGDTGVTIAGDGTIQTNASTTMDGNLTVSGNVTLGNAAADSLTINAATGTIASASASAWAIATSSASIPFLRFDTSNYRIGFSTTSPAVTLSVGGAGHLYLLGGIGVGTATTTAGVIENTGNSLFGDAAGDLVMYNSALHVFNNAGTSSIPSANANAWNLATSSANIPFVKYDTSNYRIGLSTTSPAVTLSVGGAGNIYALGGIGAGAATTTAGALETSGAGLIGGAFNVTGATAFNGAVTIGDAAADTLTITSNSVTYSNVSTSTIPSANANALNIATSSANIPLLKLDTSNTRVGISTTTPGATLAVGGNGTALIMGDATSSLGIQSTGGANKGGCLELEGADGVTTFRLYATGTVTYAPVLEVGSCR